MDSTILDLFESIIEDETLLDSLPVEKVEEFYQHLGFYLMDRDPNIDELDFS